MSLPLLNEGDRTDFIAWPNVMPMVGEVLEVIPGPIMCGFQCEHQYVLVVNNQKFRVAESAVSTPYGPNDD